MIFAYFIRIVTEVNLNYSIIYYILSPLRQKSLDQVDQAPSPLISDEFPPILTFSAHVVNA
jgi:hypothetical protein